MAQQSRGAQGSHHHANAKHREREARAGGRQPEIADHMGHKDRKEEEKKARVEGELRNEHGAQHRVSQDEDGAGPDILEGMAPCRGRRAGS
jgi:hypothetical protein